VPIELSAWNFIIVSIIALVLCTLASLIPARLATRLDPIKLLQFN